MSARSGGEEVNGGEGNERRRGGRGEREKRREYIREKEPHTHTQTREKERVLCSRRNVYIFKRGNASLLVGRWRRRRFGSLYVQEFLILLFAAEIS